MGSESVLDVVKALFGGEIVRCRGGRRAQEERNISNYKRCCVSPTCRCRMSSYIQSYWARAVELPFADSGSAPNCMRRVATI